jgi:hypothetical protein
VANKAEIHHPHPDAPPPSGVAWAAHGFAPHDKDCKLIARLKAADDTQIGEDVDALVGPPHWVVHFTDDGMKLAEGQQYAVEIYDSNDLSASIATAKFKGGEEAPEFLASQFPLSGATVHSNFPAFGGTNFAVSGVISHPNGFNKPGVTLQGPPNYLIQFTAVPPGAGYTVTIRNANVPPDVDPENNINVIP